jgi:hypothetical protein
MEQCKKVLGTAENSGLINALKLRYETDPHAPDAIVFYDTERSERLSEQPWFECAKCGKTVRESEWLSLCQDCGEAEEDAERGG